MKGKSSISTVEIRNRFEIRNQIRRFDLTNEQTQRIKEKKEYSIERFSSFIVPRSP